MNVSDARETPVHPADPFAEALRIQREASALGFDWTDVRDVLTKVEEELREVREAVEARDPAHACRELGDLLFAALSVARFLNAGPSEALRAATTRFVERLEGAKREAAREGRGLETYSPGELDALWERAKGIIRQ